MSGQSFFCLKDVPASDCSKRQQQLRAHHRAAVAVGIYMNRWYVLFLSGGWGCQTTHGKSAPSLGDIGFSWVPRFVKGLPVCLTRRHPTACGRLLQVRMGCPHSLHSLLHRLGDCRRIRESWQWVVPAQIPQYATVTLSANLFGNVWSPSKTRACTLLEQTIRPKRKDGLGCTLCE